MQPVPPVQLQSVWKSYGGIPAVKGLSLNVPAGSVYGFLGPNGAGKSTTIRMILGLQRPDRGSVVLFGKPLKPDDGDVLRRIGSLVESPSLYLHLTGRENLEVHRRLLDAPVKAIAEALDTVGLSADAGRPVHGYSSGMKQRLGLAQALLANPELLILDEPTNGLDPAGIHEVRTLIRGLPASRGVTVLVSSHLLAEMEQVATHIAIIAGGGLRFEGSAEELHRHSQPLIAVEVDQPKRAEELLKSFAISCTATDDVVLIAAQERMSAAAINRMLVEAGVAVSQLVTRRPTLEEAFLQLTTETTVTSDRTEMATT